MAELLRLPEVAAGMESAILSTWMVAENTPFSGGDVIAIIETDKAVVDVEAEGDGVILRTLVADGSDVPVGAPIALIAAAGETITDIDAVLRELGATASATDSPAQLSAGDGAATHPAAPSGPHATVRQFASPLARRLAKEAGLSIEKITGTGPNGRVVRRDVDSALAANLSLASEPAPAESQQSPAVAATPVTGKTPAEATDVPHTRLRRAIAARLTESKQTAPHFYLRGSANVDRLLALREELNAGQATRVSVNDLVIKAVARAHTLVPALNVTWTPDAVRVYSSVDIAVAIATDNGLVTPVLRSVEQMTITTVAVAVRDFADRARAGRLQQHELEGGTISVTNLGMYGTEEFSAIINPPHAAILAVGAAHQEPVVLDGGLAVATVMRVTLSIDHRPVDGVKGAQWMSAFLDLLEHPAQILA